jgi:membrane associated rhomboid family serine protease
MYFVYFYPMGLDQKLKRTPLLTYALMLCMGVLFVWSRYFATALPWHPVELVFVPGNRAPWTVATAILLHGGWLHYLSNMVYLYVFGPPLEDKLGHIRFFAYFVLLGICGNLTHGIASLSGWFGSYGVGVIGASGALAGLLGFALVRLYFARVEIAYWVFAPLQGQNRAGKAHLPVPAAVALWFGLQVIHTLVATETGSGVSYGAHLGGFALGLFLAISLGHSGAARADARLQRGRRYLERGEAYAAVGEISEYLQRRPGVVEAQLLLARSLRMAGRATDALVVYCDVFRELDQAGRLDAAVEVFTEARRGMPGAVFAPSDLARVAFLQEKQLDYAGALTNYVDLATGYPSHPQSDHALVRIVTLYKGKLHSDDQARQWFQRAMDRLPPGAWRDFLAAEFGVKPDAC